MGEEEGAKPRGPPPHTSPSSPARPTLLRRVGTFTMRANTVLPSQCWLGRGGAFSTNGLCCVLGLSEEGEVGGGRRVSVALFHGRAAEMVLVCLWGLHPLPPFLSRDIFRASPPTEYVEREYSVEEDRHKGGRPPSPLLPPSISLSFSIFWTLFCWREIKSAALGIPLNATDPPLPLLSFCSLRTQPYTHRNIIASVCFLLFPLAAANDAGRGGNIIHIMMVLRREGQKANCCGRMRVCLPEQNESGNNGGGSEEKDERETGAEFRNTSLCLLFPSPLLHGP